MTWCRVAVWPNAVIPHAPTLPSLMQCLEGVGHFHGVLRGEDGNVCAALWTELIVQLDEIDTLAAQPCQAGLD